MWFMYNAPFICSSVFPDYSLLRGCLFCMPSRAHIRMVIIPSNLQNHNNLPSVDAQRIDNVLIQWYRILIQIHNKLAYLIKKEQPTTKSGGSGYVTNLQGSISATGWSCVIGHSLLTTVDGCVRNPLQSFCGTSRSCILAGSRCISALMGHPES